VKEIETLQQALDAAKAVRSISGGLDSYGRGFSDGVDAACDAVQKLLDQAKVVWLAEAVSRGKA
jgi:hypothetical protein